LISLLITAEAYWSQILQALSQEKFLRDYLLEFFQVEVILPHAGGGTFVFIGQTSWQIPLGRSKPTRVAFCGEQMQGSRDSFLCHTIHYLGKLVVIWQ